MLHHLDVSVEVVGVGPGRDDLRAVAAHEEHARDVLGLTVQEGLEGPGHVLHVRPGEVELVYDPAGQRSIDLAGPLGLLVLGDSSSIYII